MNRRSALPILLLALAGCAQVLGFQDLQAGDGGSSDGSGSDATVRNPDAGVSSVDGVAPDVSEGDDSALDDAPSGDDRNTDGMGEAAVADAGPDAALLACQMLCSSGCCNTDNKCVGASTGICGAAGSICLNCSTIKKNCLVGACCTSAGTCGCNTGIAGCQ